SLFDEIQGATHGTPVAIDYRELSWPEDTEFIYTPYLHGTIRTIGGIALFVPFYIKRKTTEFDEHGKFNVDAS
ncbi:accessory Sec system glycosyltransferase Asp1, partial [Staphylococcus aureus]